MLRKNLKVNIGESVALCPCIDAPYLVAVQILPFADTLPSNGSSEGNDDINEKWFRNYLFPYFYHKYRPIYKGDIFTAPSADGSHTIEFKVLDIKPSTDFGVVDPECTIYCDGDPLEREAADNFAEGLVG